MHYCEGQYIIEILGTSFYFSSVEKEVFIGTQMSPKARNLSFIICRGRYKSVTCTIARLGINFYIAILD